MAQAPVPEGLSNIPDHGERSAPHGTAKGASAHLTEAGRQTYDLASRAVNATGVSPRTDRRSRTA